MKLNSFFPSKYVTRALILCYVGFVFLSWVLLFRDVRAIKVFSNFYPQFSFFFKGTREFLLHKGLNTIPTFLFGLLSLSAFFLYIKSLILNISGKKTIQLAIVFQFIILFSYPILSTDIFSYIVTSRVSTVHNANIWKVSPDHFPSDQFLKLSDWKTVPGIYGYADQIFYNTTSVISKDNIVINLILNKLLVLAFSLLTTYIVYKILTEFYADTNLVGMRLIFWNPLFLLEILGAGHNDILMIFFMLLAYYFYLKNRYYLFGTAIALSVQTKIIPVFLLIFIFGKLLTGKKFRQIVKLSIPFLIVNAICFYAMQLTPLQYLTRLQYNAGINWQSLQALIARFGIEAHAGFTTLFVITVICGFVFQITKKVNPITTYVSVILIYLLFIASAYWNWYVLWVLVFLPFIQNRKMILLGLVFSGTSLLAYTVYWTSLRFGYQHIAWAFTLYVFIFVIPIVVTLFKKPDFPVISQKSKSAVKL